jgi:hypothetical protein
VIVKETGRVSIERIYMAVDGDKIEGFVSTVVKFRCHTIQENFVCMSSY